jgi:hypothetical protein
MLWESNRMIKLFSMMIVLNLLMSGVAWSDNRQLQGTILDESGKPVSGAELFLYDSLKTRRPADYISAKTGVDGRFNLKLPAAVFWGVARVRHGEKFGPLLSGDLHSGDPQEIDLSGEDQKVDFIVADIRDLSRAKEKRQSNMSRLTGTVQDQAGLPVAAATVNIWLEPFTERVPDIVSSWTENSGAFVVYLPPGRYSAIASKEFPPPMNEGLMANLTVEEGQKTVALILQLTKIENRLTNHQADLPVDAVTIEDE